MVGTQKSKPGIRPLNANRWSGVGGRRIFHHQTGPRLIHNNLKVQIRFSMKLLLKLFIIIVVLSSACFLNAEDDNYGPQSIAGEFLKQMQANNFDQAAKLFHYPDSYPAKKKESEFRSVRDFLKRHKDQLGNITELLKTIPKEDYIGSGVSGAEIDYWSKQEGPSPAIIIPCRFQPSKI